MNYIKTAWRSIVRHRWYALQSVAGLSTALTLMVLCLLYAQHEYRFDKHYAHADRIFRVNMDLRLGEQEKQSASTSDVIGPLWQTFPEVEAYARIFPIGELVIKKEDTYLSESRAAFVDPTIFAVFNFPMVSQHNNSLLVAPHTVVVTASIAKKYFGEENAVGKMITVENLSHGKQAAGKYLITAVMADPPKTTSFAFDFLFPVKDLAYAWGVNYAGAYFTTFVLLKEGADYRALNTQFREVAKTAIYPIASRQLGLPSDSWEHFERAGNQMEFSLFPLIDIHLHSQREGELGENSNIQTLYILGSLALFALLMGIVNFINLSTAKVMERTIATGIRKVLGSSRGTLITQALVEVFLLLLISLCVAIVIASVLLPFVNDTLRTRLDFGGFLSPTLLALVLGTAILVGFAAGWYPALSYSRIRPLAAIQAKNALRGRNAPLRKVLIIFQFSITVLLLISTTIIYQQLRYIQQKDLGYDKAGILVVQNLRSLHTQSEAFKDEVLTIPGVIGGSLTGSLPVNSSKMEGHFSTSPSKEQAGAIPLRNWWVDEDYLKTMDIELLAGKDFSAVAQQNFKRVIINQQAANALGLRNVVNATIFTNDSTGYTVIGLIRDFHFESLHQAVGPLLLSYSPGADANLAVFRFAENTDIHRLMESVNKAWSKHTATIGMDFYFLDDALNETYWVYHSTLKIGLSVVLLAIIIACIGLLGMITFTTRQRIKEIGIRKVLGASVSGIVTLLTKDFVKLVLIAVLVASPIAWWAMNKWLEDFAYRIDIQWWMFALAGFAAVMIALATVSWQAVKAAVANPVDSLRDE
ncbi:ABC transporter permease [Parapedobacter sp. DT-150]|uniref:ABC transporter permease n=1 Tax=Parapedobacter sp. DT-150 TaxID=3396162 RepID=UPI003F1AAFBB